MSLRPQKAGGRIVVQAGLLFRQGLRQEGGSRRVQAGREAGRIVLGRTAAGDLDDDDVSGRQLG